MPEYKIMSYNVENMSRIFKNNVVIQEKKEQEKAQSIAKVIKNVDPHVLGMCEAANTKEENQHFIDTYLPGSGYKIALGESRGAQNLVFYYKDPFMPDSINMNNAYYEPWDEDVDEDGLKEHHRWDRKPFEAVFKIGAAGPKVMIILVHTKSKGVFDVVDLYDFQRIAQANRTKLIARALKLRKRLDKLLGMPNPLPIMIMGDMNDGPGHDPYERNLGKSFVETVMGSVYYPNLIFHDTLFWMTQRDAETREDLYTAEFPDPIVSHPEQKEHRVWIDHILVSPKMLGADSPVKYVWDSGKIATKDKDSKRASDHFAIWCKIAAQREGLR